MSIRDKLARLDKNSSPFREPEIQGDQESQNWIEDFEYELNARIIKEKNSFIMMESYPKIPIYSEVFELPFGSELIDVKYKIQSIDNIRIDQKILPVPYFKSINDLSPVKIDLNDMIYSSNDYFPDNWLDYKVGVGINSNDVIVKFLSLNINPVRYSPVKNNIEFINSIDVEIIYSEPELSDLSSDFDYDLVIITPSEFINYLTSLVDHKNNYNMKTVVKTIEDIYSDFDGRDNQEKIKYFVKYSIEEWNVKYVLLIGDITKLPIRTTDAYPWSGYHGNGILSDLYYADIYNEDFMFCSWDSNNNNIFGEIEEHNRMFDFINTDDVDLYPDVHIGRIPCSNSDELSIIVDKIIEDFKTGKEDRAPFWINLKDRFVHIEYFALRNEKDEYLGTLEVSQDLTNYRKLEGEQRILSYTEG